MNILFPAMFAGLIGLSIPVVLHLIAKHKFPIRDFPSIRLLRQERRTNVFAWKLVDPWHLLLRLVLLTLLVLAMARFFFPSFSSAPAPRNLIVVMDTSASMFMATNVLSAAEGSGGDGSPIEQARRVARKILEPIALPSRCALLAAGDEIRILVPPGPDPGPALDALGELKMGYGTGPGLVQAIAKACEMVEGRHEIRSQVVVITDCRASAFETRNQNDISQILRIQKAMKDQLQIVVVDVSTATAENLAIVEASLRSAEVRLGDDVHVLTRIRNFGELPQPTKLTLTAAGKPEPSTAELVIGSNENVIVDVTAQVNRSVRSFAEVSMRSSDAMAYDNVFQVPFSVSPSRRVLIVDGGGGVIEESDASQKLSALGSGGTNALPVKEEEESVSGARIMQYALNPGRELGLAFGTGMDSTRITPDAIAAQPLSRYDVIILYDVSRLAEEAITDLKNFVNEGRAIVIVCAAAVNPMDFNGSLAAAGKSGQALAPAQIGNDLVLEPAVGVDLMLAQDEASKDGVTRRMGPWLSPFRDPRQGDLSVIRFRKIREVRDVESGANVLMSSTEGHPLAIEAMRGQGRVILLSYGMELSRGNLAMAKVFPVLTWRMMDYVTDRLRVKPPDLLMAAAPGVLDVSDAAFRFADELALSPDLEPGMGKSVAALSSMTNSLSFAMKGQETVYVAGLPVGRYWLHKKQSAGQGMGMGYARPVVVNFDARESDVRPVSEKDLRTICGPELRKVTAAALPDLRAQGREAWRFLIILLFLAYVVEAIAGYVTTVIRDRKRDREAMAQEKAEGVVS